MTSRTPSASHPSLPHHLTAVSGQSLNVTTFLTNSPSASLAGNQHARAILPATQTNQYPSSVEQVGFTAHKPSTITQSVVGAASPRAPQNVSSGSGFTALEEVAIAKSWLAASEDAIIGSKQKGDDFFDASAHCTRRSTNLRVVRGEIQTCASSPKKLLSL